MTQEDFSLKQIRDIAKVSEVSEGFIVLMINNFRYHKGLHNYFRELLKKGEPIPKSQEELFEIVNSDNPPEFIINFQKKMYDEVKQRLGYTEEYVNENEQKLALKRAKRIKKTDKY